MAQCDDARFGAELSRMIAMLHRPAMELTRNAADAADLQQETLLRAWRARTQFEPGTSLRAWLLCIMRNACFTESRRRARRKTCALGDAALERAMPASQDWAITLKEVDRALSELPRDLGQAVVQVGALGASYAEGAAHFGCAEGTLKSRVSRARQVLRERCGRQALFA